MGRFDAFTNKYALSKTLRFELRPVGKTLEHMRSRFEYDETMRTFLADQRIEDAYQALKPVFDRIHEDFITKSLESEKAKRLDFGPYMKLYRDRLDSADKALEIEEKKLRAEIAQLYAQAAKSFKESSGNDTKGKPILKESGFKILTEAGVMKYIGKNAEQFADILPAESIREQLAVFVGFFTYFSGFNQNRENYYETKDEKATAVATRIVHENLPTFCDNALLYEAHKEKYTNAYSLLKQLGKTLEMKDSKTGEMKPCVAISADVFAVGHFNDSLSQKGIEAYNEKIANANYLVNLYNQQQTDHQAHLKIFKTLYKQIGCGKRKSFMSVLTCEKQAEKEKDEDLSLEEMLGQASTAGKKYFAKESEGEEIRTIHDFARYLRNRESFEGVYWSKVALNTISGRYLANWHDLQDRLVSEKVFKKAGKGGDEIAKIPDVIELQKLFKVLDEAVPGQWKKEGVVFKVSVLEETKGANKDRNERYRKAVGQLETPSRALLEMMLSDMETAAQSFARDAEGVVGLETYCDKNGTEEVKAWLDTMLMAVRIAQYFCVRADKVAKSKGEPMDGALSEGLKTILCSDDADWFHFYDLTRNFLTKKPQDDAMKNKLKLNFENSAFAGGWDVNKESDNRCVLLRGLDGRVLLAVFSKENKNLFQKEVVSERGKNKQTYKNPAFSVSEGEAVLQKMEYDFWSEASKMIPKCSTQLKAVKKHFGSPNSCDDFIIPSGHKVTSGEEFREECRISREVFELNNRFYLQNDISVSILKSGDDDKGGGYIKKFQKSYAMKDEGGFRDALQKWIDFCKDFLSKYPKSKLFSYNFRDTKDYESIDEFYDDVDRESYRLAFSQKINSFLVNEWVDEGKLYLFEIRNQDSNDGKKSGHKENLHTIYWRTLFENIENRPKLNGEAEIFYRRALPEEKLEKASINGKTVVKHFRFSKEKFVFHVPITLNFCRKDLAISRAVADTLKSGEDFLYLGIDRGEKNLAYYSLVDSDGKLIEQGSFNEIGKKNYNAILEKRAGDRDAARKNWKTIGTIKELKDGYISQVVRRIVDIAVSRGAFIVLENLNIGFMRGRQKIEKSVYQKLELALAKKLNFLVDKSAEPGEVGSVTRALQLTPPVSNFGDIKSNQFGIMLYVRANYTSQTDPLTGWRKTVYLKRGSEVSIKKEILETFSDIRFDGRDYAFTYTEKFGKEGKGGSEWTLYSGQDGKSLDRFRGKAVVDASEWKAEKHDVVPMLDCLFVGFDKSRSLMEQLRADTPLQKGENDERFKKYSAFEQLRFAIDLIQQIRNTGVQGNERDADFLHSPVRDGNGEHYDSRVYWDREQNGEEVSLPTSGDANGAYNIARKGIIMSEHIRRDGYKLYVSDEEWSRWLVGDDEWKHWMTENENDLKRKEKIMRRRK